jgi:hypothetical protein
VYSLIGWLALVALLIGLWIAVRWLAAGMPWDEWRIALYAVVLWGPLEFLVIAIPMAFTPFTDLGGILAVLAVFVTFFALLTANVQPCRSES